MNFENKQFMNPYEKNQSNEKENQENEESEEQTVLERIRENKALKQYVIAFAIGFAGTKGLERYNIAEDRKYIEDRITEINNFEQTNEEKLKKLEEWFGDYFKIGVEDRKEDLKQALRSIERDEEEFSTFSLPDDRPSAEGLLGDYEVQYDSTEVGSIKATSIEGDTIHLDYSGMKDVIYETFPENWAHNEVEGIYQDQENTIDFSSILKEYGLDESWKVVASFHGPESRNDRGHINFSNYSVNLDVENIFRIMSHEFAHANDWESDSEMTKQKRLNLLFSVANRLNDEDRFYSEYVENIQNEDKQKERYLKAVEYWADITEEYFTNPDNLHIKDYKLVDDVVKSHDKDFDVRKKYVERYKFISENQYKVKE